MSSFYLGVERQYTPGYTKVNNFSINNTSLKSELTIFEMLLNLIDLGSTVQCQHLSLVGKRL